MNYIDLPLREQIEEAILQNQPTMLFVEHDERFVQTVATQVVGMGRMKDENPAPIPPIVQSRSMKYENPAPIPSPIVQS